MKISKVHTTLLITMLLFGGVVFSSVLYPVSAQTAQPTSIATPLPVSSPAVTDPEVLALQTVAATQQVQIDQFQRDLKNVEWKWGIGGMITGAIVTILASLGISSFTDFKGKLDNLEKKLGREIKLTEASVEKQLKDLEQNSKERSELRLNRILEKYDLTNLPIQIPQGVGNLRRRLELSALRHDEYPSLEAIKELDGVIVVRFNEPDDQKKFRTFIDTHGPNPQKTAFVLFADPNSVEKDTLKCFENLVVANFPATVVSNILAIGRGLEIDENKKEDA